MIYLFSLFILETILGRHHIVTLYVLLQLNKFLLVSLEVFFLHVGILTIILKVISIHGLSWFEGM
jgi:hypothetical protein